MAKGPAGLIGAVLLVYGITALILGSHSFAQHAPGGAVHGKTWLSLEVNGWSGLLFVVAGLLLLFGSPLHWGAKGMSLIVGVALGAAALVALAKGHGVLGIFAANGRTELAWGVAAALLIVLSLLPRVGGERRLAHDRYDRLSAEAAAPRRGVVREPRTVARTGEPVAAAENTADVPARGQPHGVQSGAPEADSPPAPLTPGNDRAP
ncbi:MAG: hypothetical protein ACR2OB_01190 [Solirubrobacteraceae bacterium]